MLRLVSKVLRTGMTREVQAGAVPAPNDYKTCPDDP